MKRLAALLLLGMMSFGSPAFGIVSCEDVKADIAKKIEANGVKAYTLEVVAKDKDAEGKVVGTCGGGASKIVYTRGAAKAEKPAEKAPEKK
jgi:hypothetical protein